MRFWLIASAFALACGSVCSACGGGGSSTADAGKLGNPPGDASADVVSTTSADSSTDDGTPSMDSGPSLEASREDASLPPSDAGRDAPTSTDSGLPCATRITYGSAWIDPTGHPTSYDDVDALVTWDGSCVNDASNSYAVLSNGFKPYFVGNSACIMALDSTSTCPGVASSCATRITYGSSWLAPAGHPNDYDDVSGRVFSDGTCHDQGANSYANVSNGWQPTFSGANACGLSFRYTQCGGLYDNAVIPTDCPDPGVLHDGNRYVLTCTSGDAADAYPIYTSPDLATWTLVGHVFPSGSWPAWAVSDFWAPEIHVVGGQYVVYFSARGSDGMLAVGAASATSATGPFAPLTQPLVHNANLGLIDASEITTNGTNYVLWKVDGNAVGQPTPIMIQPLTADGLALTGSSTQLITNNPQSWEGAVTEGPFMVDQSGTYYLFYSGNSYANATYAVGVASASSPTGPFTKASGPIVVTGGAWTGPGHCSVVTTPAGDTAMIYAAWQSNCVNQPGCGREDLVDMIVWQNGWPSVPLSPSSTSRPLL